MKEAKTYKASDPPSNSSTGSISMELNNSMVLLPVKPMRRRYFDQRVGWFSRSQTDYGLENQKSKSVRYLDRWKLEVKKEDIEKFKKGELVDLFSKQVGFVSDIYKNEDGTYSLYLIKKVYPSSYIPYEKVYSRISSFVHKTLQEEEKERAVSSFYKNLKIIINEDIF